MVAEFMTLERAIRMFAKDFQPDKIIFNLNDDKTTYSIDCIFTCVNINGENKSMTLHSDKSSYPKDAIFLAYQRNGKYVLFDIIVPDDNISDNKNNTKGE